MPTDPNNNDEGTEHDINQKILSGAHPPPTRNKIATSIIPRIAQARIPISVAVTLNQNKQN
jgi:hypothetical protein